LSGFYNQGREDLLARVIPAEAKIVAYGVNDGYVFDATHTSGTDFEPYLILAEKELTGVSFTDGILRADNAQWTAAGQGIVGKSLQLTGLILAFSLDDVGTLFAYIDSASAGLPSMLTGVNVTALWDSRGILKL
jgi:hypothetical protein